MNSVEEVVFNQLPTKLSASVFWLQAPEKTRVPYVVYYQVSDPNEKKTLSHYGGQSRVQFNVYTKTANEIVTLRHEIRDAVRSIRGNFGGVVIVNAEVSNEVSRGLVDDRHHSSIIDVIFHWENRS